MRNYLFLLIIISTLSCTKSSKTDNVALIKGELLSGNVKNVKFEYIVDNPITGYGETYMAKVDSNAQFSIEIPIDRLATGRIRAGRFYHEICLMPGDDMYVTIKGDSIGYEGKGAEKNNFLYAAELKKIHDRAFYYDSNKGELTPEDFLKSAKNFKQKRDAFLASYKKANLIDPAFAHYYEISNQVIYESLVHGYPRKYAYKHDMRQDELQLPVEYANLSQFSVIVDDEKVISKNYIRDLRNLLFNKSKTIMQADTTLNMLEAIKVALYDSLTGKTREYVLAEWIYRDLLNDSYDSSTIQKFKQLDKDELSANTVARALKKYNEKRALIGQPLHDAFSQTVLLDTSNHHLKFGEMISRYKGNVVYLDFWAMSCGPCIAAMPYSRKLKDKLGDVPVKFVNLSVDRIPKNWWNKVFQTTLTREHHYVVRDGFNSKLLKFMGINWIPTYMIFDKEGRLVDFNASRPSIMVETHETVLEKTLRDLALK